MRLDNIKIYAADRAIKILQYLQHLVVASVTGVIAVINYGIHIIGTIGAVR